jgi:hypothetical protein
MRLSLFYFLIFLLFGCSSLKPVSLYDVPLDKEDDGGLPGFYARTIWADQINSEVWSTQSLNCISMQLETKDVYAGTGSIHMKWNKQAGGCPWLGMGIGWEGWSGKDISQIIQIGAFEFRVKSLNGPLKAGLPGAVGLEDFSGNQSWVGLFSKYVAGGVIDKDWVKIQIPLNDLLVQNRDLDITAIKQVIFTLEAEGDILMDEIKIVKRDEK